MSSTIRLPLIDMSGVREGNKASIRRASDAIRTACCDIGFFYIINHGVPQPVIDKAMAAAREFFAYPAEVKRQVAVNKRHRGWHALGGRPCMRPPNPITKNFSASGSNWPKLIPA